MITNVVATAVIGTLCLSGVAVANYQQAYYQPCEYHVERPAWGRDGRPYGYEKGQSCIARTWGPRQQYSQQYQQRPQQYSQQYQQQYVPQQQHYQPPNRQYFASSPVSYQPNNNMPSSKAPAKAIALMLPDVASDKGVRGSVVMTQESEDKPITIEVQLENLPKGKHGFHIHEFGLSQPWNCSTAGLHFNPFGKTHGAPDAQERHVGDLGNLEAGDDGIVKITLQDHYIKLFGDHHAIGRTFVVHANPDDFGLTTAEQSKITGNAGGRLACGIIGVVKA
ncbi:hypothetical protein HK104_008264 [Borealophlyctis nickersoniae]|nr:hypothetical protein HK104_008264 [Borealophlyctis nickersoniae]